MARQRIRDSWNVWRGKVNLKLDEYDPATIVAILEQLDIQNEKIAMLREDMNSVKSNIVTLNGQMTEALSSIGSLQTRVGTNEGNIATLQSSMLEAQGNIATLGGRMTTAEGNIDSLQTAMSTAQSDIAQAKSDIVDLQTTSANLQGRMTTAEGNITGLRTDVDANAAGLLAAQGNITTLQGDMTTAKSDIVTLQNDMTTAKSNITALQNAVSTAQSNISTLNTQMGTANTNIGTLQTGLQTANGNIGTLQTGLQTTNTNLTNLDNWFKWDEYIKEVYVYLPATTVGSRTVVKVSAEAEIPPYYVYLGIHLIYCGAYTLIGQLDTAWSDNGATNNKVHIRMSICNPTSSSITLSANYAYALCKIYKPTDNK